MLTYAKKRCLCEVTLQYFIYFCTEHSHGISSQEGGGENFIQPWGTLHFHLPLGGAEPNEGFKIFHTFWEVITGFSLMGGRGESLLYLPKIHPSLSHQEVPPSRLPDANLHKAHFHETLTKIYFIAKP